MTTNYDSSQPRYILVDFMHLGYKFTQAPPLSVTIDVDGVPTVIDTTIINGVVKNVHSLSDYGNHFLGVFLEGGNSFRKQYFKESPHEDLATNYKGSRPDASRNPVIKAMDTTIQFLYEARVPLYRMGTYEADDLIFSVIQEIKKFDQTTPIDVITNDADLLPLVDEQVSVYLRGKSTSNEDNSPKRRMYRQVTPRTYTNVLSQLSEYKGFYLPYNSILLHKLLRGDSSDEYKGAAGGYGKVSFSKLTETMERDGVDFPNVFRYTNDFTEVMRPVLLNYFEPNVVDRMEWIFEGMKLRYLPDRAVPVRFKSGELQKAVNKLHINLKI